MKKSGLIVRQQERQRARDTVIQLWTGQMVTDAFLIAMNDVLGIGAVRAGKVVRRAVALYEGMHPALTKSPESDYIRVKVDQRLREILGDKMSDWKDRYDGWEE